MKFYVRAHRTLIVLASSLAMKFIASNTEQGPNTQRPQNQHFSMCSTELRKDSSRNEAFYFSAYSCRRNNWERSRNGVGFFVAVKINTNIQDQTGILITNHRTQMGKKLHSREAIVETFKNSRGRRRRKKGPADSLGGSKN